MRGMIDINSEQGRVMLSAWAAAAKLRDLATVANKAAASIRKLAQSVPRDN